MAKFEARYGLLLFHRTGVIWLYRADDQFLRSSLPFMKAERLSVTGLTHDEARQRWPQLALEGVRSAYFEAEAGFIDAPLACKAVCDAIVREGGTRIAGMVHPPEPSNGVLDAIRLTNGERLTADRFVFACGPWMGELFPEIMGRGLAPTRQEVYYFGTPPGDTRFDQESLPVCTDSGSRFMYSIPAAEQRGFKVADDTLGDHFDPTAGDRIASPVGLARAREFLAERFPALVGAPLLESRVCQYENTPDRRFILDRHPTLENVWIAGGGSGHGFKFGPAVGEHMAELVLELKEPIWRFSVSRRAIRKA